MKKLNFLLVDDNHASVFFNKLVLEKANCANDIRAAGNGADAIDEMLKRSFLPDIILLDINMPVMNGWEFLAEFQKLGDLYKKSKIVLMLGAELDAEKKKLVDNTPEIIGCREKMLCKESALKIVESYLEKMEFGCKVVA